MPSTNSIPDSGRSKLDQYPFLKAALEDCALVAQIASEGVGNPRHAVCLMHDSIEFVLYEALLLADYDIYKSGQNTIGLDNALAACRRCEIDIPLIGTIRSIQKHRGDAKHHAQTPHDDAFRKMLAEFPIVISRLVHEQFGSALRVAIKELDILPYHAALHASFRKYRTHSWKPALRFAVGAVLHKHRAILGLDDDYSTGKIHAALEIIKSIESETRTANYPEAPVITINTIKSLPEELRALIQANKTAQAAERASQVYSQIDEIFPSAFDIKNANKITSRLVQPYSIKTSGQMGWSKWQRGDTKKTQEYALSLRLLLKNSPKIVKTFGKPYYEEDDDRFWRWWEFAIFDGSTWHTFHLDDHFDISLEVGSLDEKEGSRREIVAKLICEEFNKAAEEIAKKKTGSSGG
jgi:hypothetical protein